MPKGFLVIEDDPGEDGLTVTGTWIPTCTAMECWAAAAWRPVTKGELATGRASERDS